MVTFKFTSPFTVHLLKSIYNSKWTLSFLKINFSLQKISVTSCLGFEDGWKL